MKDQNNFGYSYDFKPSAAYEQDNSLAPEREALDTFHIPTPAPNPEVSISLESYPNRIEHEAALQLLGLGYSLQGMRRAKLDESGGRNG